jgi:hypothetical protein
LPDGLVRLAADENFNGHILRGLQRRLPGLDVRRLQDILPEETDDEAVLAWAADSGRILLTHDFSTLIGFAYERLQRGGSVPGVLAVRSDCPIGRAIDDLFLLLAASLPTELADRIVYVPL